MLVSCPKCQAKYDIADNLISDAGKKLRCAKCGNVWMVTKEGAPESEADILAKIGGRVKDISEDKPVEEVKEEPVIDPPIQSVQEPKPESKPEPQAEAEAPAEKESAEIEKTEPQKPQPPRAPEPEISSPPEDISAPEPSKADADTGLEKENKPSAPEVPKADSGLENNDMKDIFARISSKTEDIFKEEQQQPVSKKVMASVIKTFGLQTKTSKIALASFAGLMLVALFIYGKFAIVKYLPFMEHAYNAIGIRTSILGEGLEFQNVTRREFEEDYVGKMEIKGFIVNMTLERKKVPYIYAEMMDKETNQLESMYAEAMVEWVEPEDRVAFAFVIDKPSSMMKYILLTFKDKPKEEKK